MDKSFDPRKIIEAMMGDLGGMYGDPFGGYGDFTEYKPEGYFKLNDYYDHSQFDLNDYFDSKTIIRDAIPSTD